MPNGPLPLSSPAFSAFFRTSTAFDWLFACRPIAALYLGIKSIADVGPNLMPNLRATCLNALPKSFWSTLVSSHISLKPFGTLKFLQARKMQPAIMASTVLPRIRFFSNARLYNLAASSSTFAGSFNTEPNLFKSSKAYFRFLSVFVADLTSSRWSFLYFLNELPDNFIKSDFEPMTVLIPISARAIVIGAPALALFGSSSELVHSAVV